MGILFLIASIILDIVALSDVANSSRDTTTKAVLIILILLFPIIGASLYLLVFRDMGL
jgi:heme/copper-type cytochrome/quinol oxidase subunit 4